MDILIINLPRYRGISVTREGRCELLNNFRVDIPITLLIIASLLRQNKNNVMFIDANGLNLKYQTITEILKKKDYNCVIFTFASRIIEYDLKICDIVKSINPSCFTIGYSWFAIKYYKEILTEFSNLDVLILEEPYFIIDDLIKNIQQKIDLSQVKGIACRNKKKQITTITKLDKNKSFNDLPIPAYDLIKSFKPYYIYFPLLKPYTSVYAGKGCPYGCKYCYTARTKYIGKSSENIIKELKILKNVGSIKYIWFFDEVFTINRKRVIEICQKMIQEKLKIRWFCDSRVDLVDPYLLKIMKNAGCIGISYGVESGSQNLLDLMNKKITIEQARNALKWTRKVRIPIQLNLLLGYLEEDKKTIKETTFFIKSTLPEFLQINLIRPFEGSEFKKIALERSWIDKNLNWKTELKAPHSLLDNATSYNLNLYKEKKKMQEALYFNPKWWIICLNTLVRNPSLIIPLLDRLIKSFIIKKFQADN